MIKSIALMGVVLLGTFAQAGVTVWCANSTVKIRPDAKAQATDGLHVELRAARREVAAFQIALLADSAVAGVRANCSDLSGAGNIGKDHITIWQEHFIDTHS